MTSGELNFDLTYNRMNIFKIIFDVLSNVAYHVSLRGPAAELDGRRRGKHSQPGAFGDEHRPDAGY